MSSADRLVTLGSLALRPVVHRGHDGGGAPLPALTDPIHGLAIRLVGRRATPLFHASTNLYGFVNLRAGAARVEVTDPEGRFLPRALSVEVPDRSQLAEALARGASSLPAEPSPPLAFPTVLMRPSPMARSREPRAALFGEARTPEGERLPFAWIRVSTSQGSYVTYSDARGEYLAPLPFLKPIVTIVDAGDADNEGDDEVAITRTFTATVRAHRLLASPPEGRPLEAFPANFDALAPGDAAFAAVYDALNFFETTVSVRVEAHVRLDVFPG